MHTQHCSLIITILRYDTASVYVVPSAVRSLYPAALPHQPDCALLIDLLSHVLSRRLNPTSAARRLNLRFRMPPPNFYFPTIRQLILAHVPSTRHLNQPSRHHLGYPSELSPHPIPTKTHVFEEVSDSRKRPGAPPLSI